tara:strand:+ start:487 stop:966 length:480 start_codon:yes stop_codon:yes gene_type:complete
MDDVKLQLEVQNLYSDYVFCVDNTKFEKWRDFFTEDCLYRIVSRENFDAKKPMSTLQLEGQAMLKDRVHGMNDTIMHVPYYQRHIVSPPRIHRVQDNTIHAEANYLVVRSRDDTFSEVFNTGRYLDVLVRQGDGQALKIKERVCVFDGDLVPNSIVYPL